MTDKPGPELEAKVAEEIMGWIWKRSPLRDHALKCLMPPDDEELYPAFKPLQGDEEIASDWHRWVPWYSRNIADAMRVIDKMAKLGYGVTMTMSQPGKQCGVKFFRDSSLLGKSIFDVAELEGAWSTRETLPHAICCAALLTLGVLT